MTVVDLFAGPGGWDVAAQTLGLEPLGVEFDANACATRAAAGLSTVRADVSALNPADFAPLDGLIASPPCQAFSMAGKGEGRKAIRVLDEAMADLALGRAVDTAALADACDDPRADLVLEPLRWTLKLRPSWVACEQVEPVLPLWESMASVLRRFGYHAWTGVLSAEQYGVPQTRRRAILIAHADRPVRPPEPTHQRYVPPRTKEEATMGLFDAPDPERIVVPEDARLLPWVSMAEALRWPAADEAGFPRRNDRDDGADYRERDVRPATEPAFALTEKARSWTHFRATNGRPNAAERPTDAPAPTLAFGHEAPVWVAPAGQRRTSGPAAEHRPRTPSEPSFTLRSSSGGGTAGAGRSCGIEWVAPQQWVGGRPATTVNGDPRISHPGHHDEHTSGSQQANAIRVTEAEAAVLQSFPPDYPWQGTKTKRFEQIGNAIPPLLAQAILKDLTA